MGSFLYLNRNCPICNGSHKDKDCRESLAGLVHCRRGEPHSPPPGWEHVGADAQGFEMYAPQDGCAYDSPTARQMNAQAARKKKRTPGPGAVIAFNRVAAHQKPLTNSQRERLAASLGLPHSTPFDAFPVEYLANDSRNQSCFIWPERHADLTVCGWSLRYADGTKRTHRAISQNAGPARGLTIPDEWDLGGPIFNVEGMTDTLTMRTMGLTCIGRSRNDGEAEMFAEFLTLNHIEPWRPVIIFGENDSGPGRAALTVAAKVATIMGREVWVVFPPDGSKDVREWFKRQRESNPNESPHAIGQRLLEYAMAAAEVITPPEDAPVPQPAPVNTIPAVGAPLSLANVTSELPPTQTVDEVAAQHEAENLYCPRPNKVSMEHREHRHHCCICWFPCKQTICDGCRNYRMKQFAETIHYHLIFAKDAPGNRTDAAPLWLFYCQRGGDDPATAKQWTNASERIRGLRGSYFTANTDGAGWLLCVSTVRPLPSQIGGAEPSPITPQAAAALLSQAVRDTPRDCVRPFASSRHWKLVDDVEAKERYSQWRRIGIVCGNAEYLERLLRHRGADRIKWIQKQQRFFKWQRMEFDLPAMQDYKKARLWSELEEGQQLYSDEDFHREPPRRDGDDHDDSGTALESSSKFNLQSPFD